MNSLEIMVFAAPVLAVVVAVSVGVLGLWLSERAERRKAHRSASTQP
jgi:hypothetical protein